MGDQHIQAAVRGDAAARILVGLWMDGASGRETMDGIHAELSARALDWNVHCLHCAPTLSSVHFDGLRAAATGLTPSRWREQAPVSDDSAFG